MKTQQEIERIMNNAKESAAPLLALMSEIASQTTATAMFDGSKWKVTYSHESDPVYLDAKGMAEEIFKDAQMEINS